MEFAIDPVCDMEFDRRTAAAQSVYQNRIYYFCHPVCKKIFDADPTRFIEDQEAEASRPATHNADEDMNRKNVASDCEWIRAERSAKRKPRNVL